MIKIPLDFSSKQSVNEPRSLLNIKCGGKMSEVIFREILKLKKLKLETLEMLHKKLFDAEYSINREYLYYTMASRLYGLGIDVVNAFEKLEIVAKSPPVFLTPRHSNLPVGTIIPCEYGGVKYHVEVMKESFKFKGDDWSNLRDIMKEIVAGKLDEKKFFGLSE
jgi:hypothetical protein